MTGQESDKVIPLEKARGQVRQGDKVTAYRSVTLSPPHLATLSSGLIVLLPLGFLAVFYLYPLIAITRLSLAPHGTLDLRAPAALISSSYYRQTLWFTTWQALASTALTLIAGLPAAYIFARYDFPGKSLLRSLTTIPFVLPTVVVAVAFTSLAGPSGVLNLGLMRLLRLDQPPLHLLGTIWMILLAHVFYNYCVVLRIVGSFWANLGSSLENAAAVLGANRVRRFFEITLPLLTPAIAAAALLVFIFDFTSFGVVLILGGTQFATLEVEIYRQTVNLFNLPMAAALSLVQVACTLGLTALYTRLQARTAQPLNLRPQSITQHKPSTFRAQTLVMANVTFMMVLLVTPLMALVWRSAGEGWQSFAELSINRRGSYFYVPPVVAIRNSLVVAGITITLSLALGFIAANFLARRTDRRTAILDPLFMLPLGTSAVTLGFGYIIALGTPPLDLRASPAMLPLAHTLVAFPFVVRSLLPVLRGIRPSLREAAAVMGASPWRVWREVDLPIVGRAMLVAAAFAFAISMGEFGATALVARPEFPTMPVVIYRFLGQPGALNYGQALAMSTLLMLVCAVGIVLIERVRVGEVGEF
jgi:thiamine transport system permease protein